MSAARRSLITASARNHTKCNIQRAAEILNKTRAAVYMDVARRRIPFRKDGRRIYFFEEELLEEVDPFSVLAERNLSP